MTAFKIKNKGLFRRLYHRGDKMRTICRVFGCSVWAAKMARRRFGLSPRPTYHRKPARKRIAA